LTECPGKMKPNVKRKRQTNASLKKKDRGWGTWLKWYEYPPSKYKALSSNFSTSKEKKKVIKLEVFNIKWSEWYEHRLWKVITKNWNWSEAM
jgi:hypothetical protein